VNEPADHGLGRSRRGLTTKVHLACEQGQRPLSVVITAGQRGDSPQFQAMLERLRVPRPGGGHPAHPAPPSTNGSLTTPWRWQTPVTPTAWQPGCHGEQNCRRAAG
jgi:hypothetical protein